MIKFGFWTCSYGFNLYLLGGVFSVDWSQTQLNVCFANVEISRINNINVKFTIWNLKMSNFIIWNFSTKIISKFYYFFEIQMYNHLFFLQIEFIAHKMVDI